jgi:hypothetical protein
LIRLSVNAFRRLAMRRRGYCRCEGPGGPSAERAICLHVEGAMVRPVRRPTLGRLRIGTAEGVHPT